MFHQSAGIWRTGLPPGSSAADEANSRRIGEESKPEPGAKRPPKTAQARIPHCADIADRLGIERTTDFIEEGPVW
jgi:hypothetical protein